MGNRTQYSNEPSSVTFVIGIVATLLGLGLAVRMPEAFVNGATVAAIVSVFGALVLGVAQNGRISGVFYVPDSIDEFLTDDYQDQAEAENFSDQN